MQDDAKQKLVKALRSGEYKQGRGYLRIGNKYCCLGVLCDIIDPSGWKKASDEFKGADNHFDQSYIPSQIILDKVGLTHEKALHLAKLNDEERISFEEIADFIEQCL